MDHIRNIGHLIADGNIKAFEEFYHLHKDRVYEIALRYTRSVALSEEILQDVFVQVWVKRSEFTKVDNPAAWLFTLTRNRSFNALRQTARNFPDTPDSISYIPVAGVSADDNLLVTDLQKHLLEAMKLLSPAQRSAFQYIKVNGLTREETARAMQIAPNTVKVHLLQAMRIIRAYIFKHSLPILIILHFF